MRNNARRIWASTPNDPNLLTEPFSFWFFHRFYRKSRFGDRSYKEGSGFGNLSYRRIECLWLLLKFHLTFTEEYDIIFRKLIW